MDLGSAMSHYNKREIKHKMTKKQNHLWPNYAIMTYIFEVFNENLKPRWRGPKDKETLRLRKPASLG